MSHVHDLSSQATKRRTVVIAWITARYLHAPLPPNYFDAQTLVRATTSLRRLTFYPGRTDASTSGIAAMAALHARFPIVHVKRKTDSTNAKR